MTYEQRPVYELSLLELVEVIQSRTKADPISASQQLPLLHMIADLLQACAQETAPLFPRRDMQEIRGQYHVKRALEVAAAGGHNILLVGPSGAGKTLLAQAFPSILPQTPVLFPFRSPHSSIGRAAFLGEVPFPGELTRAHGGVLLLKELASFDRSLLAAVVQAVETHLVMVNETVAYPAHFLLVATMKPCPCGFYGDALRECTCSVDVLLDYAQSLQEVIDACFDMHVAVPILREDVMKIRQEDGSLAPRRRVEAAREQQRKRYAQTTLLWVNADLRSVDEAQQYCTLDSSAEKLLNAARQQLHFTPHQSLQTQRVARTIADLASSEIIAAHHIAEAIQYRSRFGR